MKVYSKIAFAAAALATVVSASSFVATTGAVAAHAAKGAVSAPTAQRSETLVEELMRIGTEQGT